MQTVHHFLRFACQEALGIADIAGIVSALPFRHARPGAASDLVQQAGSTAVVEDRVLAGAQFENLLDQLDRLFYRPGTREGPEVAVALVDRATVIADARISLAAELQIGIALVVAEQDIELGVQSLDQIVFQQQGLGLGANHRGFHPGDACHHHADAAATMVLLEIAGDAFFQMFGLADIKHLILGVEIAIDTWHAGQRGDLGQQAFTPGQRVFFDLGHALNFSRFDHGAFGIP